MVASQAIQCASVVCSGQDAREQLPSKCRAALESLRDVPDLVLLFATGHHAPQLGLMARDVCDRLGTDCLLGCAAEGVAGTGMEIQDHPAIVLWLAKLPDTRVIPMHLEYQRTPGEGSIVGWPESLPSEWTDSAAMLVLGEPFSFPADVLVEWLHEDHPGTPVIGGMASAAHRPGENRLVWGGHVYDRGAVAVFLQGSLRLRTIVSQGCRPIGSPFVVTKAERNVIHELGGVPAYERLKEVYLSLATREQRMVERGLHLGRVVNEYQGRFEQGDFLVRNVMGVDPDEGTIAIGDYVRRGQTVQFHVRDAETADGELRQLLRAAKDRDGATPKGALLFTCNGRGSRLFGEPHHDVAAIERAFGSLPLAGFFAAGELGPIGGRSFVHGFTASIALVEQR